MLRSLDDSTIPARAACRRRLHILGRGGGGVGQRHKPPLGTADRGFGLTLSGGQVVLAALKGHCVEMVFVVAIPKCLPLWGPALLARLLLALLWSCGSDASCHTGVG
jgi:hypothetical protein